MTTDTDTFDAQSICSKAASLVGGDRARTHGDKTVNHANIAALWNAYLGEALIARLTPTDVALMMALLKIARTKSGTFNRDDFVDLAGYAGVAGEIAGKKTDNKSVVDVLERAWADEMDAAGATSRGEITFRQQMNLNRGLDI